MKMATLNAISRGIYKRSADPRAAENVLDSDFQEGFILGRSLGQEETSRELHDEFHPITVEWDRRGKPTTNTPEFKSWKAGYWAGVMSKI